MLIRHAMTSVTTFFVALFFTATLASAQSRLIYNDQTKSYFYKGNDDVWHQIQDQRKVTKAEEFTDGHGDKHKLDAGAVIFKASGKEYVANIDGTKFGETGNVPQAQIINQGAVVNGGKAVQAQPGAVAGLSQVEQDIVNATNQERVRAGLQPLAVDAGLMATSRQQAGLMAKSGRLQHGLAGNSAENIGQGHSSGADVVNGWMNSRGHRANLLNPNHTVIGVGNAGSFWAQQFR